MFNFLAGINPILGLAGTLFGAKMTGDAGVEQQSQYDRESKEYKQAQQSNTLEAADNHLRRLADLQSVIDTNIAISAILGRDASDRSLKALKEKTKRMAEEDINISDFQYFVQGERYGDLARESTRKGIAARQAANMQAMSTVFNGLTNFSKVR